MPKKFPAEFKRDVVRVARRGDLSHTEVAADFDISVESVRYNRRRRQRALGKLTPVEFELAFTDQAAAVAA